MGNMSIIKRWTIRMRNYWRVFFFFFSKKQEWGREMGNYWSCSNGGCG
jgi:hypothetical protein